MVGRQALALFRAVLQQIDKAHCAPKGRNLDAPAVSNFAEVNKVRPIPIWATLTTLLPIPCPGERRVEGWGWPPWDDNVHNAVYGVVNFQGSVYQILWSDTTTTIDGTSYTYAAEGSYQHNMVNSLPVGVAPAQYSCAYKLSGNNRGLKTSDADLNKNQDGYGTATVPGAWVSDGYELAGELLTSVTDPPVPAKI
ncbi:MAG: hypothetical protein ACYC96_06630 [Fimbriimonadaceae bacterium]